MALIITEGTYTVLSGETLSLTNPEQSLVINSFDVPAVVYDSFSLPPAQFVNHGTVELSLTTLGRAIGFGVKATAGFSSGLFHNAADGVLRVTSSYEYGISDWLSRPAYGFYVPHNLNAVEFLNDGLLEVNSPHGDPSGIGSWASFGAITNNGSIRVSGGGDARGIEIHNGSTVDNNGLIEVSSDTVAFGVWYNKYANGFNNTGTILATTDPGSPYASIGVFVGITPSLPWGTGTFEYFNSGSITADYAFWINPGLGAASTLRSPDELHNSGEIHGVVGLAYGNDILHNSGLIDGYIELGEGDDFYDGVDGLFEDILSAGIGDDLILGGAGDENFFGEQGNDVIAAGAGGDFVDGGRGSDALDGGTGFDTLSYLESNAAVTVDLAAGTAISADRDYIRNFEAVLGSAFDDHITGSAGNEVLRGAGGDDRILGGAGQDTLAGDTGADVLTGNQGADTFVFSLGDGHDEITDFSPLLQGDRLQIRGYSDYADLQQVGADTLLVLSGGDSILLRGVTAATLPMTSLAFDPVLPPPAPEPSVPFAQSVVHTLVIQEGEVLRFVDPQPWFIDDQAFFNNGLVIQPLDNLPIPAVFNAGTLQVEVSLETDQAVGINHAIGDSGSWFGNSRIVNLESGSIEVITHNAADALGILSSGGVWNHGQLRVTSAGGDAQGVEFTGIRMNIVNDGIIEIMAGGSGLGFVVEDSSVWNSGSLLVTSTVAGTGVRWSGASYPSEPMRFVNSGTLRVTDSTPGTDSIGISFSTLVDAPYIWNSGSIEADYAIRYVTQSTPDPTKPSEIYNSGSIQGRIALGNGADLLVNSGSISGLIEFGGGNDRYDGRAGTQSGGILGGDGADVLLAGSGADNLDGGDGGDVLSGGAGSDTLTGGSGSDTFRFEAGFGQDTVTDFAAGAGGDLIEVTGYGNYSALEQTGADTLVTFAPGESLLLLNTVAANLVPGNFNFAGAAIAAATIPAPPPPPDTPEGPAIPDAPTFPTVGVTQLHLTDGVTFSHVILTDAYFDTSGGPLTYSATLTGGAALPGWLTFNPGTLTLSGTPGTAHFGQVAVTVTASGGTEPDSANFLLTVSNGFIEALRDSNDLRWNGDLPLGSPGTVLTYSFMTAAPSYADPTESATFEAMTATQMQAVREVLQMYSEVAGLSFSEVADTGDGGQLRFGTYFSTAGTESAYAYSPGGFGAAGDVWVNRQYPDYADPLPGDFAFSTLLHEIGHALGLKHPGNYGEGDTPPYLPAEVDNDRYTVMSYVGAEDSLFLDVTGDSPENYDFDYFSVNPRTPMLYDVATIQFIYGANAATRSGDDLYTFDPAAPFFRTLWDGGGSDTISVANFTQGSVIDLRAGQFSSIRILSDQLPPGYSGTEGEYDGSNNLAIAYGTLIENAIGGSGNDTLTGNAAANRLEGGGGADVIDGGAGNDLMIGGGGHDTYFVDSAGDQTQEEGGAGTDFIRSTVSWTLAANTEELQLLGASALNGSGNGLNNWMQGNSATNILDGMAGNDSMIGLGGNDTYLVDSTGDRTIEAAGAGTDFIRSTVSWTLAANTEELQLLGTSAINGSGNGLNNWIQGNSAANILDGKAGNDRMIGQGGSDTYFVDSAGDQTIEAASAGTDFVRSTISWTLMAHTEELQLLGTSAINGSGNELNNWIQGNSAANVLDGKAGNDTMIGLGGNDTYMVDSVNDKTVETASAGTDFVRSAISWTLMAHTEELQLLGSSAINGSGNELNNWIQGNSAANVLDGKAGADAMIGLGGNDTYMVDSVSDKTIENASAGTDFIRSTISWTLTAHTEELQLLGGSPINGSGNELNNWIMGNSAANILDGKAGNDSLITGGGADIVRFSTALGPTNIDRITDFSVVDDTIQLVQGIFMSPALGVLGTDFFRSGAGITTAGDGDDYLIYNTSTGALYYDADGNAGVSNPQQFAVLTGNPALTAADFFVTV